MSRTDAHTRHKFLEDGREWERVTDAFISEGLYRRGNWPEWNRDWNTHYARPAVVHWYQEQENRRVRRQARQAIQREDFDSLPTHMTGRHTAAWLAY